MAFIDDLPNLLNPQQLEAVTHPNGPQMVIAGAGSGKTRVLTFRIAYILDQGLAYPQEILSLTFTNKAAKEMKERIALQVGPSGKSVVMGTFHSIFSKILRIEAERIGYTSSYTIYDSDDSLKMIKILLKEMNLDDKVYKPKVIKNGISSAKNQLTSPKKYLEFAQDDFNKKVAKIYQEYERRLYKANAMDFDDLLIKPIVLFKSHPEILYKYQHRFKYILVDEYQDTNHAQYTICKMMAAANQNITVVGDDAQSIYAFRGANIANIFNFQKDYPEVQLYKLEQNYRSTQNIVEAANDIIKRNKDQIPKKIFTANEEGDLITVLQATSEQDEAKRVSNMLREHKQVNNFFNSDFAILYRTNAQSRALEDELRRVGITYRVFGGLSFYQRKEVKDVIAYLRLAINPQDETALKRIINYPTRGIGNTSLQRIAVFGDQLNLSFWEALNAIDKSGLNAGIVRKIQAFTTMVKSFAVVAQKVDAHESASHIAKESGILKALHGNPETLDRWENVQELLNAAQAFTEDPDIDNSGLESFLADISLFTDADASSDLVDYVTLMTVHSAKGLEFKSVFLVGMEESIFPSGMALETRADLEEERRLFYVAITRAEKRITMSHAKSRYRFGQMQFNEPSRFLDEIDDKFLARPKDKSENWGAFAARRSAVEQPEKKDTSKLTPLSSATRRPLTERSNFKASDAADIVAGLQVEHQKFGKGKVLQVEGAGPGKKATVFFKGKGQRVLLLKYAKLQIIG